MAGFEGVVVRESKASGTAMGAAAVRAIESEKPADERVCCDPLARRFVDPLAYRLIKLFAGYGEWHTKGGLTFIVCRCRYIDDYLQECLKSGIDQLVILGAGLDSRAYRDEVRRGVARVFEVDHPATQASKIERVKKVFGEIPAHVTYVPVDFTCETLDELFLCGFDPSLKTLYIWEGVTLYLDQASVDATLAWIRSNSASGSSVIFDYQEMSRRQAQVHRDLLYAIVSRWSSEKDVFGFERGQIEDYMVERGYVRVVDASADDLTRLYCTGSNRKRKVGRIYSIVHADVGDQPDLSGD